ncbi:unnamed protein product, partial [Amoebophrya sp. A25]|eukprot:GSA25T00015417001.1
MEKIKIAEAFTNYAIPSLEGHASSLSGPKYCLSMCSPTDQSFSSTAVGATPSNTTSSSSPSSTNQTLRPDSNHSLQPAEEVDPQEYDDRQNYEEASGDDSSDDSSPILSTT